MPRLREADEQATRWMFVSWQGMRASVSKTRNWVCRNKACRFYVKR